MSPCARRDPRPDPPAQLTGGAAATARRAGPLNRRDWSNSAGWRAITRHLRAAGAVRDNPPVVIRDGGVIADGYDTELDELRQLSSNAGDYLLQIEQRERARPPASRP